MRLFRLALRTNVNQMIDKCYVSLQKPDYFLSSAKLPEDEIQNACCFMRSI